jgi:Domain of unknown function (DUF4129)
VRIRGRLAAFAVAALALVAPSPAAAEAVSGSELVALADQAVDDEAARARLLAVDEVDGRPVAVRLALAGARGKEIADRARLIAALAAAAPDGAPAEARAEAHAVLDDARFEGAGLPRPLDKPLAWLSDRIEPIIDAINDAGGEVPGGPPIVWTLLAFLVLLLAGMGTSSSIRRRVVAIERERAAAVPEADDPHALERAAGEAEREGQWERAVRLRFRAGLLRLDRRKVLVYRPSLTTGEVARTLKVPAFDEVGSRFDEIAYGGREAQREDAKASEQGWKDVLTEVGRR